LDAKNRPLFKAKHILTDDKLQKCFYFDVTTIPPVLKISPVLIEDEGNYRFRVVLIIEKQEHKIFSQLLEL
jgi:hypothetical protein